MDDALVQMLNQTIRVLPYMSRSGSGETVYGPEKVVKCFVDGRTTMRRDSTGKEIVSQKTVYVADDGRGITVKDKIILSDGRTPSIIGVEEVYDDLGILDHTEIYL